MTASSPQRDTGLPGTLDVFAVIVSYHPSLETLHRVVDAVAPQVGKLLVFDNGTSHEGVRNFLEHLSGPRLEVWLSPTNLGIAAAINAAAEKARDGGFRYLLLLDQDSIPDFSMVAVLKQAFADLAAKRPVAAVGPAFQDPRTGLSAPFVRIGFPVNHKISCRAGGTVECDFLITSGSLIPLTVFETVGPMDVGLFIDNVDLEWCFRARHHGLALYGICDARMRHTIGDDVRPSRLRQRGFVVHSPVRLYYIMRNRVLLYGRRETPRVWIAQDLPRVVLKFLGTILLMSPRKQYLRRMWHGLCDGVRGVTGPLPPEVGRSHEQP